MWIEVTGIPGSGKSHLARNMYLAFLSRGVETVTPLAALTGTWIARWIESASIENRVLEATTPPASMESEAAWRRAMEYVDHASLNASERRRLQRCVTRQFQISQLARRQSGRLLLVDEGTAHLRLMLMSRLPTRQSHEVAQLNIPWPDVLVVTRCPAQLACHRLQRRGQPPFRNRPPQERMRLVHRAESFLPALLKQAIRYTVIVPVDTEGQVDSKTQAAHVCQRILAAQYGSPRTSRVSQSYDSPSNMAPAALHT